MNQGTDKHFERSTPKAPAGENFGPGQSGRVRQPAAGPGREVMNTLLGENNLAAFDTSGSDPYNATGKFFRR